MLDNEIKILKTLDHPNVIKCYDIYKTLLGQGLPDSGEDVVYTGNSLSGSLPVLSHLMVFLHVPLPFHFLGRLNF